jgi:uncharacterized protein (UPF0264 family)
MDRSRNRKLLVSVFGPQEAREAVLGGARIVDSEDPRSALGNIKPQRIMDVSDAVLAAKRDLDIQLSTNIGEDQLLYRRSENGQAIQKSPYEIAGKASQAALGVANAMGVRVHPSNIVKVGVDGMNVELVSEVLTEVALTLKRTKEFSHCQVMGVLFAQDMDLWNKRKTNEYVRKNLIELREFHPASEDTPNAFDLTADGGKWVINTVRDQAGKILFNPGDTVDLYALHEKGVLPDDAHTPWVALNELFPHSTYYPTAAKGPRTNKEVIKLMVDAAAGAGATSMMLDTQIQTKVANICLIDTGSSPEFVDLNQYDVGTGGLPTKGILTLDELRFFVEYAHFLGIEANLAGSLQSFQAQQVWVLIPQLDQVSTRGGSSAVQLDPYTGKPAGEDTRQQRIIKRRLVAGLVAPEQGGVLNIPEAMKNNPDAVAAVKKLVAVIQAKRADQRLPELQAFWVDKFGNAEVIR